MQLLFLLLSVTFWLLGRGEKNSGVEKVGCLAIVLWLPFLAGKKGIALTPYECAECVVRFLRCLSIRIAGRRLVWHCHRGRGYLHWLC